MTEDTTRLFKRSEPNLHAETLKLARACEARAEVQRKQFGDENAGAKLWDEFGMKLRRLSNEMPI